MYMYIFLACIIVLSNGQQCNEYVYDEFGCITSTQQACKWNDASNQCLDASAINIGCLPSINQYQCLSQYSVDDDKIAQCIFNGYCRGVTQGLNKCTTNLSMGACLAVTGVYCYWNGICQQVLTVPTDITHSSVDVCKTLTGAIYAHNVGLWQIFTTAATNNPIQSTIYYQQRIQPGCQLLSDSTVLKLITCTTAGLNSLGCQSVQSYACIFTNGSCQLVTDYSGLLCSSMLNKVACLAITNISEPCTWKANTCQKYVIGSSKCADIQSLVSPSVCANVSTESCFYDESTNTCSQKCLNPAYTSQLLCEQSGYSCTWSTGCGFAGDQCGLAGQNLISCSVANSNCQFVNGVCKLITNLSALKCNDGLNLKACLALTNVSQTCQFEGSTCDILQVLPTYRVYDLTNVNANACSKITTEAAYFQSPSCAIVTGAQSCDTVGFNKLACFGTTNTLNPCGWNSKIGICQVQVVTRNTQCTDLVSVNSLACQSVNYFDVKLSQYQLCSYNRWTYNCVIPTITATSTCTDLGLNSAACQSISNLSLACRWLSNQCILVTSLGAAVNCSILSTVTPHTCELVTSNQICGYDSNRHSCTTSISPSTTCTTRGLNCYACASLNTSCYFDTTLQQCFNTSPSVLSSINCVSNFPSQGACISITTNNQYCQWSSVNTACSLLKFPTNLNCSDFQNVNRLTCLAYMVNISGWVESQNYCTYSAPLKGCMTFIHAIFPDCGTGTDMNVHACVALSNPTKECYFDTSALTCGLISSYTSAQGAGAPGGGAPGGGASAAYAALQCAYVNKLACLKITTSGQYCQWTQDAYQSKCAPATIGGQCNNFTNVNANVCATVNQSACQFDNVSACIAVTSFNIPCSQSGLNQIGCVSSTQQACQFDNSVNQCSQITGQSASKLRCESPVNKLGCLAVTGAACQWINNACKTVVVAASTDLCTTYQSGLYNAIVCSSITTAGQYCTYDSTHFICSSDQSPVDCQVGYNTNNCFTDNGCLFMQNICASQSGQNNACSQAKNQNDCVIAQNLSCQFSAGTCSQINVNRTNPCSSYSNPTRYNAFTCTLIQSNTCVYDNTNNQCVVATLTNYQCNTQGLSLLACLQNTTGNCMYSTNQGNYGCGQIQGQIQCSVQQGQVNVVACLSVGSCIYQINSGCLDGQTSYTCSELSQTSKYYVSSAVCTARTDVACMYNPTNQVCRVVNTQFPQCSTNSTINSVACLNNVVQTCDFVNNVCTPFTDLKISCSKANSFRKCISSTKESCQWNNGVCQSYTVQGTCTQQTNINAMACMQVNKNQQCQFQDNGLAASACVIVTNTLQACFGLNQGACILATLNPCYFTNNQCIDISIPPYTAQCTNGYYFSQSACARIQTPGQPCAWNGTNCITVNVNPTDNCSQYSQSTYGPQVCAKIQTSICYWNSGCQSTGSTTCTYLSQSIGQNSLACVNATGNCVFTNYTCLDATVQDTSLSSCSDPSNIGGCTRMNYGQTCQWNGTTCSTISVTYNCTHYTNVSPGVCAATSDVACMWSSMNCIQTSTGSQPCSSIGFNSWACTTMTAGYCYFNSTLNQCQTLTSVAQSCTNLNQNACLANTTTCCFWNGNMCVSATPNSTCSMTNYSQYCCTQPLLVSCSYTTTCTTLTVFTGACSTAANLQACINLTSNQCEWLNNACVNQVTTNNVCQSTFNALACINVPHQNTNICKFIGTCQTATLTSCSQLLYFSQPSQCSSVTDVGCYQGTNGCIVSSGSVDCQIQGINQIACLQNVNTCIWNNNQCSTYTLPSASGGQGAQGGVQLPKGCIEAIPNSTYSIYISRKLCAYLGNIGNVSCFLNVNFSCTQLLINSTTTCNSVNTSFTGKECAQISTEACMFDSTNFQCTNTISGSTCVNISLNQLACQLISNNCIWSSNACALNTNFLYYTCSVITSRYTCLTNIYTSCQWQSSNNMCVAYSGSTKSCTNLIASMTSPGVCWYYSNDYCGYNGTTCVLVSGATSCSTANSPLSCQAFGGCYWDNLNPSCQTLVLSTAPKMTCSQLRYTTQAACVLPLAEGQTCYWNGSQCVAVNAYTAKCTDPLALQACRAIATVGQSCVFQNSACQPVLVAINLCTDNVNIYGCMSITTSGQYCQWLGQQCATISPSDGYTIDQFVLVNPNVCNKVNTFGGMPLDTLSAIGAKYSATGYQCVENDILSDQCDTPGLNYYACLSLLNDTCSWNGVKCVTYTPETITQCSDYQTVSPMVCQSIESGQLCKWSPSTYGCTDMDSTDICSTRGLNQAACLAISTGKCIWQNNQCSETTILLGFTSCTSFTDPVNALTCAAIDYNNQVCRYNKSGGCTTGFDPSFQDCDSPGLNLDGCVQVLRSKCIFLDGKCQFYTGNATDCSIQNVNANVCKFVTNQACKFSRVKRGCTQVFTSERCSAVGLNKIGCQLSCQWIDDLSYCTCQSISNYLSLSLNCNSLTNCSLNSKCIMNNGTCRTKLCTDYPVGICQGQQYWKYTCYLSNNSSCQGASQCNELIGVSDCTTFTLNNIQCVQDLYNVGHCVDYNCVSIRNETQCTGQCQWITNQCITITCSQLTSTTCQGIYNSQQCIWSGQICYGVTTCQAMVKLYTNQQQQCQAQTVLNKQCYWQQMNPYSQTYTCSSSICASRGQSSSLCHGGETRNQVCILTQELSCLSCTEITDPCLCANNSGYCYYNNQGCFSNLCSGLDLTTCTTQSARCGVYSSTCKVLCVKLIKADCLARNTECHWTTSCQEGVNSTNVLNTLSTTITVTTATYSAMILIWYFINI